MAQNITLMGASYSDVPAVTLPKTGGGTAQFDDTTDANATASDIASGKTAYVNGAKVTGTASGGGSSGLEYESGTYTPTNDISRPQIDFSRTHSDYPVLIVMADQNNTYATNQGTNTLFVYFDPYRFFGKGFTYNTSSERYAVVYYSYQGSSSSSNGAVLMQHSSDETGFSDTSYPRYWVQKYRFYPYSNSTSRYWRKNRTYKWIAIWKPTT